MRGEVARSGDNSFLVDISPNLTDQPTAKFYFRDGDREITTSVYGLMCTDTKLPAFTEFANRTEATPPPELLFTLSIGSEIVNDSDSIAKHGRAGLFLGRTDLVLLPF